MHAFYEYFISDGIWDKKMTEFLELTQGNKTVLQYEFTKLARYAPLITGDYEMDAKKF